MAFFKAREMSFSQTAAKRKRAQVHTDNLMMVLFDFEDGPADKPDPLHSHPHEQISYVVSGRLVYLVGDQRQELQAGDLVTVPPNVPHAIQPLSKSVRLADAFTPLREDFLDRR